MKSPPDRPIVWVARAGASSCNVTAQSWFEARRLAAVKLGAMVEVEAVTVEVEE